MMLDDDRFSCLSDDEFDLSYTITDNNPTINNPTATNTY